MCVSIVPKAFPVVKEWRFEGPQMNAQRLLLTLVFTLCSIRVWDWLNFTFILFCKSQFLLGISSLPVFFFFLKTLYVRTVWVNVCLGEGE